MVVLERPANPGAAGSQMAGRLRSALAAQLRRTRVRVRPHAARIFRALIECPRAPAVLPRRTEPGAMVPRASLSARARGPRHREPRRGRGPERARKDHRDEEDLREPAPRRKPQAAAFFL